MGRHKSSIVKYPLVLIKWKDAQSSASWEEKDEIDKWAEEDYIVNDVGFIIKTTKNNIILCSQIGADGSFGNKTKIPKGWVIEKIKIK